MVATQQLHNVGDTTKLSDAVASRITERHVPECTSRDDLRRVVGRCCVAQHLQQHFHNAMFKQTIAQVVFERTRPHSREDYVAHILQTVEATTACVTDRELGTPVEDGRLT